jgi:succinate dehydrogenase / fumarate reductase cytochrome b subunit
VSEPVESWLQRHHFLLRRLHSLSGVIPVGAFLVLHLFTNSLAAYNAHDFDKHVKDIHAIPYLPLLELVGIFLPLAFHAGYGVVIARQGRANVLHYGWLDNWRYTLQRVTAWIALVFVVAHLAHYRFAHWFGGWEYQSTVAGGVSPFDLTAAGFAGAWGTVWLALYLVGLISSIYHFCNGLGTFCITWGITIGDVARRRVLGGAAALGVLMLAWGAASLWALNASATASAARVSQPPDNGAAQPAGAEVAAGPNAG